MINALQDNNVRHIYKIFLYVFLLVCIYLPIVDSAVILHLIPLHTIQVIQYPFLQQVALDLINNVL